MFVRHPVTLDRVLRVPDQGTFHPALLGIVAQPSISAIWGFAIFNRQQGSVHSCLPGDYYMRDVASGSLAGEALGESSHCMGVRSGSRPRMRAISGGSIEGIPNNLLYNFPEGN